MKHKIPTLAELRQKATDASVFIEKSGCKVPKVFVIGIDKKTKGTLRNYEIYPGLFGEVMLHGNGERPTVLVLKCRDVILYTNDKKNIEIDNKTRKLVDRFLKRKKPSGTGNRMA